MPLSKPLRFYSILGNGPHVLKAFAAGQVRGGKHWLAAPNWLFIIFHAQKKIKRNRQIRRCQFVVDFFIDKADALVSSGLPDHSDQALCSFDDASVSFMTSFVNSV